MAFKDIREYLARLEEVGELQRISGAQWDLEIGVISELSYENQGPALLFEEIPGYSLEYEVVSNLCSTERRSFLALGWDAGWSVGEVMRYWKEVYPGYRPVPPVNLFSRDMREQARKKWGKVLDLS